MVDPITALSITFAIISGIDHFLSFTPDGYPKSLIQVIIWCGHKIYVILKKKPPSTSGNNTNEYELISVVI
jgi:hypothetical protein